MAWTPVETTPYDTKEEALARLTEVAVLKDVEAMDKDTLIGPHRVYDELVGDHDDSSWRKLFKKNLFFLEQIVPTMPRIKKEASRLSGNATCAADTRYLIQFVTMYNGDRTSDARSAPKWLAFTSEEAGKSAFREYANQFEDFDTGDGVQAYPYSVKGDLATGGCIWTSRRWRRDFEFCEPVTPASRTNNRPNPQ